MSAQDLKKIANELRGIVLRMVEAAGSGHLAGPMSSADLFATLYFGEIVKYHPDDPWNNRRDRVVLSCGHYAPILYAALGRAGFFEKEKLLKLGQIGGLPVHPERFADNSSVPGVEASAGPLGQGMSVAVGIAKALKLEKNPAKVYCVCSDGELQEGQAWEAIGLSVREKLDNLIWLIDANNVQIEHYVSELSSGNIVSKLEAWGCHTLEVDGNDPQKIRDALLRARESPVAMVLHTVAGRGVSYMENDPQWHDGKVSKEQLAQALKELDV